MVLIYIFFFTVFSHLSNWDHLKDTIDGILKRENLDDYEPKAVLDFLSTCVFLKMQWQSNTHKPKHDSGKVHQIVYDKAGMVEALKKWCVSCHTFHKDSFGPVKSQLLFNMYTSLSRDLINYNKTCR